MLFSTKIIKCHWHLTGLLTSFFPDTRISHYSSVTLSLQFSNETKTYFKFYVFCLRLCCTYVVFYQKKYNNNKVSVTPHRLLYSYCGKLRKKVFYSLTIKAGFLVSRVVCFVKCTVFMMQSSHALSSKLIDVLYSYCAISTLYYAPGGATRMSRGVSCSSKNSRN